MFVIDLFGDLRRALQPSAPIQAAPDCGLVPLSAPVARAKLKAMVAGARLAREQYGE